MRPIIAKDITGMRFRNLLVLGAAPRGDRGKGRWYCRCDCGTTKVVDGHHIKSGAVVSCGCHRKRLNQERCDALARDGLVTKHRRAYASWRHMMGRCYDPENHKFPYYGARGIRVCEQWHTLAGFLADMGDPPVGMTLDRRENDGNYELSNCRWATPLEQAHNRRPWGTALGERRRAV